MKKRILVKIKGGLGNQFFQYATALATRKKVLCDISGYSDDRLRDSILNYYNISGIILDDKKTNIYRKIEKLFKIVDKVLKNQKQLVVEERESFLYSSLDTALIIDGYWQNLDYFRNIRSKLISEFSYRGLFSIGAERYKKNIEDSNSIAIHIRRTDYLSAVNASKYVCQTMDYYARAIAYIKANIESPAFFVFSDDIAWCKKQELFSNQQEIMFIENIEDESSVQEFELMRKCRHFIIANSTFSWWASYLSDSDNKIVVSPQRWMVDNSVNEKVKIALLEKCVLL